MLRQLKSSTSPIIALTGALALTAAAAPPALAQKAGVTTAVNVDARRTPPESTTRRVLIGDEIVYNELIETDNVGQAQVLMLDRTALTIGPNSSLLIDKFVYDPEKQSGDMNLTLKRGLLRFVGGRISKKSPVKVNTPVGVLGIRGGIALINVVDQDAIEVTFLFGDDLSIFVGGEQVQQLRRAGFKTRLTRSGAESPWEVSPAEIAEDMDKLQGRPGEAGGLAQVPDASLVTLLTEGALPVEDFQILTEAIDDALGNTPSGNDFQDQEQTKSESQVQVVTDKLPETHPNPPPEPPSIPIVGFARQTDHLSPGSGSSAIGGLNPTAVETIQLIEPAINNNASSIAFDPNLGLYYGSQVGNVGYSAAVWDPTGTEQQLLNPLNIDARSWFYNPNTGNLELVTYQSSLSSGLFTVERNPDGSLLGSYGELIANLSGSPTSQTMPSYNPATNELYAYGATGPTVSVLDRATGNLNSTITLDLASAGISGLSSYFIGYDPNENVLIGTSGATAYVFGLDGSFLGSSTLTLGTDGNYDAGYANGQLFLYNDGIQGWQGFDIFESFGIALTGDSDGSGYFSVTNGVGALDGDALDFITDMGDGPAVIFNPFDPNDPAQYDHPDRVASQLEGLGVSPAIAARLAGPQIVSAENDFFALTYSSLSNANDPLLVDVDKHLTVFAGVPYDLHGSSSQLLAYELETDPNRFSRHAFSLVGRFDTAGPSVTDIDFGLDVSAYQTPLYVDLARGKVFLASKVAQGDFANYDNYVFQAGVIVGDIGTSGSNRIDAGGGEIVLGSVRDEEFTATQTFDAYHLQGFGNTGKYVALAGSSTVLDGTGTLTDLDYAHIGQAVTPALTLDMGPAQTNQLLAAGIYQVDSPLGVVNGTVISATVSSGGVTPTPGTLSFDRTNGEVAAVLELQIPQRSPTVEFAGANFKSAYLDDSHFGIGSQGFDGNGGFLVSGKATSPADPCTCEYLHWGYWAHIDDPAVANSQASGVFVAGIPTPQVDMPLSGTATYNGVAEAAWRGPSASPVASPVSYASGDFSHTVDFATGSGNGTMSLNGTQFTSQSVHVPGEPNATFAFVGSTVSGGVGTGVFTGPQAENLGVVFELLGTDGLQAAGAIRAERGAIMLPPAITPP